MASFNIVTAALREHAGVEANLGKCRMWNRGGVEPPGAAALGEDVWVGSPSRPAGQRGIMVLGSPIGTPEFVRAQCAEKRADQQRLLDLLPALPDLQCAWALLSQYAGPRSNHIIRTVPPTLAATYAEQHDLSMQAVLWQLLQQTPTTYESGRVAERSALPGRLGGTGLRSAARTSPAAYWASWADALPVLRARSPTSSNGILDALARGRTEGAACLREATACRQTLVDEGFDDCPTWRQLWDGMRPDQLEATRAATNEAEPGEWRHGWQFIAASQKRKPPQRQCCDAVFTATSQGPLELADRPLRSEMVGRGAYMPGNYVHTGALPHSLVAPSALAPARQCWALQWP